VLIDKRCIFHRFVGLRFEQLPDKTNNFLSFLEYFEFHPAVFLPSLRGIVRSDGLGE
jgi:hypothetical protein